MTLDFQAGNTPLTSRQNPVIYLVILTALAIAVIFALIRFITKMYVEKRKRPEWIEAQKNRLTKYKDIKIVSEKYDLTPDESALLWKICKKFKIKNIVYYMKDYDSLKPFFKQAYFEFKKANDELTINKLFLLRFKIENIFASNSVISSTKAIPLNTKLNLFAAYENKASYVLEENKKDYLALRITDSYFNSHERIKELNKAAFSFTSAAGMNYAFVSRIIRYQQSPAGNYYMLISHSSDLIAKLQRHFKRVDVNEKCSFSSVKVKTVKREKKEYVPSENHYECNLVNISGGGCCIASTLPIKAEQFLSIEFSFKSGNNITAIGKIVRTRKAPAKGIYNLHIHFEKITIQAQNNILSEVYEYY